MRNQYERMLFGLNEHIYQLVISQSNHVERVTAFIEI